MSHTTLADWFAFMLWGSLAAFAIFGGADFGAGIWDLLAQGQSREQQRGALIRAIGPIWEGNEIWVIFLLTGAWTGLPLAFATIFTALFIPLTIGLLGTVMRGAAFAYYSHFRAAVPVGTTWERAFSAASTVTPFLFGASAAAVVSGHIRLTANGHVVANLFTTWTTPFALCTGCFAVAFCATLAAVFMTVEVRNQEDRHLVRAFRQRAFLPGGVAAALCLLTCWLASFFAPYFFGGLTTRGLWLALCAVAGALATGTALLIGWYRLARVLVVGTAALALGAWTVAQLPYIVYPDVRIETGAAPSGVLTVMLIAGLVAAIIVGPPYVYMLYLFKARNRPRPATSADDLVHELEVEEQANETSHAVAALTSEAARHDHPTPRRRFDARAAMLVIEGALLVALPAIVGMLRSRRLHRRA